MTSSPGQQSSTPGTRGRPGCGSCPGADPAAGFCLVSVCFLDLDPDAFWLYIAHRDTDLEDAPLVAGGDVLGVHLGGQPDQPGERAVTELGAIGAVVLLATLRMDCQGPALDGDLDVPIRVQAGKLGPDYVAVVPGRFLDPETLGRRELRRARPWRLQPVDQAREQSAEYRGRLRARQLFHDVLPLHMLPLSDLVLASADLVDRTDLPAAPILLAIRNSSATSA